MRIAIIGTGNVGSALATAWARSGHAIVLGVRKVDHPGVRALADETRADIALPGDAAAAGDVVVLALPWSVAETAVRALGDLSGKIVIDCMNPLRMANGSLGLDRGFATSGAETLAGWIPSARVVKTLNQVGAEMMARAGTFASRPVMFMAGDDADAKSRVGNLLAEIGFEPLDAGDLTKARLLEPYGMVWINQALPRGYGRDWAFGVVRPRERAIDASGD